MNLPLHQLRLLVTNFIFPITGLSFNQGIAYQQDAAGSVSSGYDADPNRKYNDPLADADACKRDVKYFKESNTNALRVYAIDPDKDHEECMKIFSDAGIYIVADLSEPTVSINRNNLEWNLDLYKRYTKVIDKMQEYSNVLGFLLVTK